MARNKRYLRGERLVLPVPENTVSGSAVAIENRGGIALTDRDDDGNATVDFKGVYNLPVNGAVTAIGQAVYYTGDADPDDRINVESAGNQFFGYALQIGTDEELPVLIGEASGISEVPDGGIETRHLDDDVLSADADGRGKMQDDFFNSQTIQDKFETNEMDTDAIDDIMPDHAIPENKLPDPAEDGLNALRVARATYDVTVDGGAIDRYGLGVTIPDDALIVGGLIDCLVELDAAADGANLQVGVENAATDCNDILAAVTADGSLDVGQHDVIPDMTASEVVKTTDEREITVRITDEEATAGKIVIYLYYLVSE